MKEYYIYLNQQEGPFTIEELRSKKLSRNTPAWHDGLNEWSTIGEIPELLSIVKATPPPYKPVVIRPTPPPYQTEVQAQIPVQSDYEYQMAMDEFFPEKKKIAWGTIGLVALISAILAMLIKLMNSQ